MDKKSKSHEPRGRIMNVPGVSSLNTKRFLQTSRYNLYQGLYEDIQPGDFYHSSPFRLYIYPRPGCKRFLLRISVIVPYLLKPRDVPLAIHAKFFGLVETSNTERKKPLRTTEKNPNVYHKAMEGKSVHDWSIIERNHITDLPFKGYSGTAVTISLLIW